jgi:hypothetical protein
MLNFSENRDAPPEADQQRLREEEANESWSFDSLSDEEKKERILSRWQKQQARMRDRVIVPGAPVWANTLGHDFARGFNAGTKAAAMIETLVPYASEAIYKTGEKVGIIEQKKNREILRDVKARQRNSQNTRNKFRAFVDSRIETDVIDTSETPPTSFEEEVADVNSAPVTTANEQTQDLGNVDHDMEPGMSFPIERDATTILGVISAEKEQRAIELGAELAPKLFEKADSEQRHWLREGSRELANDWNEFYMATEKMVEQGDLDSALRHLDSALVGGEKSFWDDDSRSIAVELGRVQRELIDAPPVSFDDVSYLMTKNASGFLESGDPEDINDATELLRMLDRTNEPGDQGIAALEELLDYSERILAVRTSELNRNLGQMKDARATEDVSEMHEQEARIWRTEVEEARRMRDAVYSELVSRRQSEEESIRQEKELQEGTDASIEEIRNNIDAILDKGNEPITVEEHGDREELAFPSSTKLLNRYSNEHYNLPFTENDTLERMRLILTPELERDVRGYVKAYLCALLEEKKADGIQEKYVGSTASVLGAGGNVAHILERLASIKNGRITTYSTIGREPFTEVAKKYLDINVEDIAPDYYSHFSR